MIYSALQNVLSSKTIHLRSGQHLFTQGDSVKNIYCLKKGRIKLVRDTLEGTPILVHVAYADESIAEASQTMSERILAQGCKLQRPEQGISAQHFSGPLERDILADM